MQNRNNVINHIADLCRLCMDDATTVYKYLDDNGFVEYDDHSGLYINPEAAGDLIVHAAAALTQ